MKKKKEKGITLVALVITIIILIILAGVSINIVLGEKGILSLARKAKKDYEKASIEEKIQMYMLELAQEDGKNLKDKLIEKNLVNEEELEEKGKANLDNKTIIVSSIKGLNQISNEIENGADYTGKFVYLTNDIDANSTFNEKTGELLTGESFTPIGDCNVKLENEKNDDSIIKKFNGTFDGLNYTIKNLYIKENDESEFCTGFFGYVGEDGIIKNLTISNSYIEGYFETGAFVGRNKGKIINCTNEAIVKGHDLTGGIVGRTSNNIENCVNKGNILTEGQQTGGIVGNCDYGLNNIKILNCLNLGMVNSTDYGTGGIAGCSWGNNACMVTIENCINEGTINGNVKLEGGTKGTGGIVGTVYDINSKNKVTNCKNTGRIIGIQNVGGIVGFNRSGVIELCTNTGEIEIENIAGGGICGLNWHNVFKCSNTGNIQMKSETGYGIGGITGISTLKEEDKDYNVISECYNEGEISAEGKQSGGISGNTNGTTVENCYNLGKISAKNIDIGGIIGCCNDSFIKNSYNIGQLEGTTTLKGGIIGALYINRTYKTENCYWLNSCGVDFGVAIIENKSNNDGAESKTLEELKNKETFIDWDFDNIWQIDDSTPYLR